MSLPADARETIRLARDRHVRQNVTADTSGRAGVNTGTRQSLCDVCFDAAKGDPLLALSFAADAVLMRRDMGGQR